MNNKKYSACALGEILIDFTRCGINESGQRLFVQNPGGAPANVMAAMSVLGAKTSFIGKVGTDMHGLFLKETLENSAINTDGLVQSDEYFTTLAFVDIKEDGEREFSFARNHGADKTLTQSEVNLNVIRDSNIFHIGSVSLTDEDIRSTTLYALNYAKKCGDIISYDPNYRATLWKNEEQAKIHMRSILPYADLVKISDEEIELLTDETDYKKAAECILNLGVSIVVVTLGAQGAYVSTQSGGVKVDGYKSKAIDATGAGDSFWGAFLYKISETDERPENISLNDAAEFTKFANASASLCVEGIGAIPSLPDIDKVKERLKLLK